MPILSTIFLWLEAPQALPASHPAEHGIVFGVIMAPLQSHECRHLRPFSLFGQVCRKHRLPTQKEQQNSKQTRLCNLYFWIQSSLALFERMVIVPLRSQVFSKIAVAV